MPKLSLVDIVDKPKIKVKSVVTDAKKVAGLAASLVEEARKG